MCWTAHNTPWQRRKAEMQSVSLTIMRLITCLAPGPVTRTAFGHSSYETRLASATHALHALRRTKRASACLLRLRPSQSLPLIGLPQSIQIHSIQSIRNVSRSAFREKHPSIDPSCYLSPPPPHPIGQTYVSVSVS